VIIHTGDDALFVTISPAVYFGTGGVVIFVVVVELWLEQPAKHTQRIRIKPNRRP
jgi:hypothetical protein